MWLELVFVDVLRQQFLSIVWIVQSSTSLASNHGKKSPVFVHVTVADISRAELCGWCTILTKGSTHEDMR
jgi:hypothetical protein